MSSSRARSSRSAVMLASIVAACGADAPPAEHREALPSGVVAMVGDDAIDSETVARIAAAQRVAPAEARGRAISDAVFAAEAAARFGAAVQVSARRSTLARMLLEELRRQAEAQGPVTDGEVARLTKRHWLDLDRPRAWRTIHAAALTKKAEDEKPARATADRILEAVRDAKTADEFRQRAEAVPHPGIEVVVQKLDPVAEDGRLVWMDERPPPGTPDEYYHRTFAAAVTALREPGDKTPVFESRDGYHVAMLLEVFPEQRVSLEQRRALVADEALGDRMAAVEEPLLAKLKAELPVAQDRAAASLIGMIDVRQ